MKTSKGAPPDRLPKLETLFRPRGQEYGARGCFCCEESFFVHNGCSDVVKMLCEDCWRGMVHWYARFMAEPPRQYWPGHVHAYVESRNPRLAKR